MADAGGGIHNGLPNFMIATHHLGDRRDAEDYVERVGRFGRAFDQVLEGLELREETGIVPPRPRKPPSVLKSYICWHDERRSRGQPS